GVAAGAAFKTALSPLASYLNTALANPALLVTTLVGASGIVNDSSAAGIAGGVNVLQVDNQGAAGIASGASVNQHLATPAGDQDVHIQALGTIGTVNVAGQNSSLNFGGS